MLTIRAPAKLNLTLEVLGERQDGFHEIRSVIQAINLCDSLHFQLGQDMRFKSDISDWIPEQSLVSKAAGLIREATGCTKGATIEVNKRIPWLSGLGGDSSNAAAVLRGLNKLWELGLSLKELLKLAAQLSSDTSFFLYGGTALAEGRGEIVTPLPSLSHMWVVLVVPHVPRLMGKTERLYASLKTNHYTDGQITERLVDELKAGRELIPSLLFNTFENVAFARLSEIGVYRDHIMKIGATHVHLAGSGPALFTLVEDKNQAEKLHILFQQQALECFLIDTLPTIEQVE